MIARVWILASREWRENLRQRGLLAAMSILLLLIGGGVLYGLSLVDGLVSDPSNLRLIETVTARSPMPFKDPARELPSLLVTTLDYLVFSQLLGMTAVIAGHAGIHDRLCGTLPFLLLSPVRRVELLAGKVLGALSVPLAIYVLLGGGTALLASRYACVGTIPELLPPSASWAVAFLLGGPAWALFIATLCVVVSALSPDVRTAQQVAWVIVFFATLVLGPLLVSALGLGWALQAGVAFVGLGLAVMSITLGTLLVGRDLSR